MIEVKIDKDVREYQEKTLLNLTARQLCCGIIALAISAYLFYSSILGPQFLNKPDPKNKVSTMQQVKEQSDNTDMASWLIIFVVLPIIFVGFFRPGGMYVERFAFCFAKDKVLPKKRVYRPKNAVHAILKKESEGKTALRKERKGEKADG